MMERKRKRWTSLWPLLICCLSLNSCTSSDQIRYEQFVIAGGNLYQSHCANCHGKDGEGLRQLYPALVNNPSVAKVDYLTCLIREGGKDMPANKELYAIDIAQISTFIKYKWAEDKSITEITDVEKVKCATVQN